MENNSCHYENEAVSKTAFFIFFISCNLKLFSTEHKSTKQSYNSTT